MVGRQGYAEREFSRARTEGRRESFDAYAADGLLAMARDAAARTTDGGGRGAKPPAAKVSNQVARLENDHRLDWAATRHTTFSELDPRCPHHHTLETRENWQLVRGTGKRRMVPPGDPEHPGRCSPARAGPRARAPA